MGIVTDDVLAAGRAFIEREGRIVERRLAEVVFDGGWPITWEPPGAASALDWRGIETLRALRILRAYGRAG